jgi:hypothetical protein
LYCADGFYSISILNQADLISLPITFIEAFEHQTWKRWAIEAKTNVVLENTIFEFTLPAMFRFGNILSIATEARFFGFQMDIADSAIYPTRGQHGCRDFFGHFHSGYPIIHFYGFAQQTNSAFYA